MRAGEENIHSHSHMHMKNTIKKKKKLYKETATFYSRPWPQCSSFFLVFEQNSATVAFIPRLVQHFTAINEDHSLQSLLLLITVMHCISLNWLHIF